MSESKGETAERDTLLEGLRRCGLNGYESAVYLGLVTDQGAKVAEISKRTGVPQPKIYQALDSLVEKGFCALGSDAVNRYRPIPPHVALERFVNELDRQKGFARTLAGELDRILKSGEGRDLWAPPVEVLKGLRQIEQVLVEHVDGAQREILCFCKGPQVSAPAVAHALRRAGERGVRLSLLSDREYYETEPGQEEQAEIYRALPGDKRELESVPTKMILVDRRVVLVAVPRVGIDGHSEDHMVQVLRQEGLVQHFLASFRHHWQGARPVRQGAVT